MKSLIFLSLFFSSVLFAASDSVGVFHRPEKVVVLINDRGEAANLQNFMNHVDAGETLQKISKDGKIKIICGRTIEASSCTFTFFPSDKVTIGERFVKVHTTLEDLDLNSPDDFKMSYESSMGDQFFLKIIGDNINFYGSKKKLQ